MDRTPVPLRQELEDSVVSSGAHSPPLPHRLQVSPAQLELCPVLRYVEPQISQVGLNDKRKKAYACQ